MSSSRTYVDQIKSTRVVFCTHQWPVYLTLALSLFCSRMQIAHVALLFQKNSTKSVGDKTTRRVNVLYACVTYFISHRFLTYKHGIRVKPIFLMPIKHMNYRAPDAEVHLNLSVCTTRHIKKVTFIMLIKKLKKSNY